MNATRRRANRWITGLLLAGLWSEQVVAATKGEKSMIAMIHANVSGCAVEVRMNDIPMGRVDAAEAGVRMMSSPAAMYLVDGKNELRLIVQKTYSKPGAHAQAWVTFAEPGAMTGGDPAKDPNVALLVEWEAPPESVLPAVKSASKELKASFGGQLWERAPVLALDPATQQKAAAFLESVRAAFIKGDGDAIVAYTHPKLLRGSQVFEGRTIQALEQQTRQMTARLSGTPGFSMAPLDPAEFDFHLVAGGRLIECTNTDGLPTLRPQPGKPGFPPGFPMMIGLDNGNFRVFL